MTQDLPEMKLTHRAYIKYFSNNALYALHEFLFRLSIRGMGIYNGSDFSRNGELQFLTTYLPGKTGTLIDVGANMGHFTLQAASLNPYIQIHSFEPHPITFDTLTQNTAHVRNVQRHNKGLSSSAGELELFDYAERDGSAHASMYPEVIEEIHGGKHMVKHKIELATLDQVVEECDIDEITLLKIDTEGHELQVLMGASKTMEQGKIKAIQFEFNEMNIASKCHFKDFWDVLNQYSVFRILPNGLREIKTYSPLYHEIYALQNYVAILR